MQRGYQSTRYADSLPMSLKSTSIIFIQQVEESFSEIIRNLKFFLIYVATLALIYFTQEVCDTYLISAGKGIQLLSRILFSAVPLIVQSKILYIIKIRHSGEGEYKTLLKRYFLYSVYYFLVLFSIMMFFGVIELIFHNVQLRTDLLSFIFLIASVFYIMIFYALTPLVAVFSEDTETSYFRQSKKISSKNIMLIIINHLFALALPMSYLLIVFVKDENLKLILSGVLSIPVALGVMLTTLTSAKIYFYLSENGD
jgi:hypothetical protein